MKRKWHFTRYETETGLRWKLVDSDKLTAEQFLSQLKRWNIINPSKWFYYQTASQFTDSFNELTPAEAELEALAQDKWGLNEHIKKHKSLDKLVAPA
jgi:hypothetical protein